MCGVALGEFLVAARGGFCFAWGGIISTASFLGYGGREIPFLMAFALSALRWACAGLIDFSLGILAVLEGGRTWAIGGC